MRVGEHIGRRETVSQSLAVILVAGVKQPLPLQLIFVEKATVHARIVEDGHVGGPTITRANCPKCSRHIARR